MKICRNWMLIPRNAITFSLNKKEDIYREVLFIIKEF